MKSFLALLMAVLFALLAIFVWPGFLRYDHQAYGIIRVDRLTGHPQKYNRDTGRWEPWRR